jgi:hypothetical protein
MPESTETSSSFEKASCTNETGAKITIQSLESDDHVSPEIVVEKEKPTVREVEPTVREVEPATSTETPATDCSFANKDSKITSPQVSNDATPLLAKEDARNEDDNVAKPHPRTIRTEAPSLESHLFDRDGRLDQGNQMRPPWPLLSSPKDSPKQSEAHRGWSGSGFRRDQLKRQSRDAARYNPSPTNGVSAVLELDASLAALVIRSFFLCSVCILFLFLFSGLSEARSNRITLTSMKRLPLPCLLTHSIR